MKAVRSALVTLISAGLIAACAAPGESTEEPQAAALQVFSHSAYTFAANIDGDFVISGEQFIGRTLPNIPEIQRLVAERLEGDVEPSDLRQVDDYTISFSIANDVDSDVATHFRVDTGEINGMPSAAIHLVNPFDFTFDRIRDLVSQDPLRVQISVDIDESRPIKDGYDRLIEETVRVDILDSDDYVDLTNHAVLEYTASTANFSLVGGIEENKRTTSAATFGLPNNPNSLGTRPLSAWGVSRANNPDSNADRVTLFYALRDNSNIANSCAEGNLYFDNNDNQIKSAKVYNYEADPTKTYNCRLAVSTDGGIYHPIGFSLNASLPSSSARVVGNAALGNIAPVVPRNANNQQVCTATNACYYADISLSVQDVNEAPQISRAGVDLVGSAEGAGPLSRYANSGLRPYEGELAAPRLAPTANQFSVDDEDIGQTGTDPNRVAIASITPNHGARAFSVEQVGSNRELYRIVVNSSFLNYEAFQPRELTGGKAIYTVRVVARDDKSSSLAHATNFNYEVTDVKYPPVFVNPNNRNGRLAPADAFIQDNNIITADGGTPIYLAAGLQALEFSRIGQLAAVNPETGSPNGLTYRIASTSTATISNNLRIVPSGDRLSQRLVVAGFGLTEGQSETVGIEVSAEESFPANSFITSSVALQVRSSAYAEVDNEFVDTSDANITFSSDTLRATVSEDATTETDIISLSSSTAVKQGAVVPTPNFGFAPANQLPADFAADLAQLGFASVAEAQRKFVVEADGSVKLRAGQSLRFPNLYVLPVFVNAGGSFVAGTDDVTILTIIISDVNSAPVVTQRGRSTPLDNADNKFTASINENLLSRYIIGYLSITDDNQNYASPTYTVSANANDLISVEEDERSDGSLFVTIYSKRGFDYEDVATRNALQNIQLVVTDTGSFRHTSSAGQILPRPIDSGADDSESTTIGINITLRDLGENPELEITENAGLTISEGASLETNVRGESGTVVARLTNPTDFPGSSTSYDPERVELIVLGPFAGILDARFASRLNGGKPEISIAVMDADRLEDLGDGRTFPLTILARDSVSRKRSSVTVNVKIENNPAHSLFNTAIVQDAVGRAAAAIRQLSEQDVAGRSTYVFPRDEFYLQIDENLAPDANEYFPNRDSSGNRIRVLPLFGIDRAVFSGANGLNPSDFFDATDIIKLEEISGELRLVITDTNFIERSLFGNIDLFIDPSPSHRFIGGRLAPFEFGINVNPAPNKQAVYGNTPPVYAFSYNQNAYAASQPSAGQNFIHADDIPDPDPTQVRGVNSDYISIDGSNIYETDSLMGESGRFIKRQGNNRLTTVRGNAAQGADGNIVIRFSGATGDLVNYNNFDILRADDSGKLIEVGQREFANYFEVEVNNSQGARRMIISPRQIPIRPTSNEEEETFYNALDTLPIFEGESYTLNYFIRAKTSPGEVEEEGRTTRTTGASNYALAQFSVRVTAVGDKPPAIQTTPIVSAPRVITGFTDYESNIVYQVTVTDTDEDNSDPAVTVDTDSGICSVSHTSTSTSSTSQQLRIVIRPAAQGNCIVDIEATEDGLEATRSISIDIPPPPTPQTPPRVGALVVINGFTDYFTDITYRVTVTDTDGAADGTPVISVTSTTSDKCSVSHTSTSTSPTSQRVSITITPLAKGTCTIEVTAAEDGSAGTGSVTINLPEPPDHVIRIISFSSTPDIVAINNPNFDYDTEVNINWVARITGDDPPRLAFSAGVIEGREVCRAGQSEELSRTAEQIIVKTPVIATKPGRCTVIVRINSDGVTSRDFQITYTFPETPPKISLRGLYSTNISDFSGDIDISDSRITTLIPGFADRVAAGSSFLLHLRADKSDPGFSTSSFRFVEEGNDGGTCRFTSVDIDGLELNTPYNTARFANHLYRITNTGGGACGTMTFRAEEDGQAGSLSLAQGYFSFEGRPRVDAPAVIPGFTNYATDIIYQVAVTDTDGVGDGSPVVNIASTTPATCSARNLGSATAGDIERFNIAVTPLAEGPCTVEVTAEEGGAIGTGSSRIDLPPPAPTLDVAYENAIVPAFQDITFTLTATKQSNRRNLGNNGLVSFPSSFISESLSDSNSGFISCFAIIEGNAANAETIDVEYSANERGATASATYTISSTVEGHCGNFNLTASQGPSQAEIIVDAFEFTPRSYFHPAEFIPSADNLPDDFNYTDSSIVLSWLAVAYDNNFPITEVIINSTTPEVCSLERQVTQASDRISGSDQVTPIKPGLCTISLQASTDAPGVANSTTTASIILPEIAPDVFIQSLYRVGAGDITDIGGPNANQVFDLLENQREGRGLPQIQDSGPHRFVVGEERFVIRINAVDGDPSDDDPSNNDEDVTFSATFVDGDCSISPIDIAGANAGLSYTNGIAGQLYLVEHTGAGGACPAITLSANEDGVTNNVTIPSGSFFFDAIPSITEPQAVNSFSDFDIPINYTATLSDPDGNDGSSPTITATPSDADICSPSIFYDSSTETSAEISIVIIPINIGSCVVEINVTEDGLSGALRTIPPITLTATGRTTAPGITTNARGRSTALIGSDIVVAVTATKRDTDSTTLVEFPSDITGTSRSIESGTIGQCTASINDASAVEGNYASATAGEQVTVNYTISSTPTAATCEIAFNATEDALTGSSSVSFEFAPYISGSSSIVHLDGNGAFPEDFNYADTFDVRTTLSLQSIYQQNLVDGAALPQITHSSNNPEVCSVVGNQPATLGNGELSTSTELMPLKPGTCELILTVTANGAPEEYSFSYNINLPELPPIVFLNAFYSTNQSFIDEIGDENLHEIFNTGGVIPSDRGVGLINGEFRTSTFGEFYLGINASSQDPGDDDNGVAGFAVTSLDGDCDVRPTELAGRDSFDFFNGGEASQLYRITHLGTGGPCQAIELTVTENGESGSVAIPANTLVFDAPPEFTGTELPEISTNYYEAITPAINITDNDGNDGYVPTVRLDELTDNICSATLTNQFAFYSGSTDGFVTIRVEPIADRGICMIEITPEENGYTGSPQILSINILPPVAPMVVANSAGEGLIGVLGQRISFNVVAIKRDGGPSTEVSFPRVVNSTSDGDILQSCQATLDDDSTLPPLSEEVTKSYSGNLSQGSSASVRYIVNSPFADRAANCGDFNFTATENGEIGEAQLSGVEFLDTPLPFVEVSGSLLAEVGQDITLPVTAIKQDDDAAAVVSFRTRITSDSGGDLVACEAFIEGATGDTFDVNYSNNATGVIGFGSSASVTYTIISPETITRCGAFRFSAQEGDVVGSNIIHGVTFYQLIVPTEPESSFPGVELSGDTQVQVGQPIFINVMAIKRNNNDIGEVKFPANFIVPSDDRQATCEAFIEGAEGDNVVANYDINRGGAVGFGSMASVIYRINSPASATRCLLTFSVGEGDYGTSALPIVIQFGGGITPPTEPPVDPEPPTESTPHPAISFAFVNSPPVSPVGQDVAIFVTATKQNSNNATERVSFPTRVVSSNNATTITCEAFIAGTTADAVNAVYSNNDDGVIGVGSSALVQYTIASPSDAATCGAFSFDAFENGERGSGIVDGVSFFIEISDNPSLEISGNKVVQVGHPIILNVAAIKRNNNNIEEVTFPARFTGTSEDRQTTCEAFIEAARGSDVVARYSINSAGVIGFGSRASVTYRINSPANPTICSVSLFADENGQIGSTSIELHFREDPSINPPTPPAISISGSLSAFVDEEIALTLNVNKQSSGSATMVSLPTRVVSAGGCVASLAGEPEGIIDMAYDANSAVDVVYTIVPPSNTATRCGLFQFTATEATATATLSEDRVAFIERVDTGLNVFVNALYSPRISYQGNPEDINFADLGRFFETPGDSRQYQGLDLLRLHTPQTTDNDGAFFIEVNATLDTPLADGQDMSLTFSESFSAGVCSIAPVSISGREQDLSLDNNIAGTLYRIAAANSNGGTCPEFAINVTTAAGVTSSITIDSGSFIFESDLFLATPPSIEISGDTEAQVGQPIIFDVMAIKRSTNNNDNVTFPARLTGLSNDGQTTCEAFAEGAGGSDVVVSYDINSDGVIGVGSRASVTYRINSPANPTICLLTAFADENGLLSSKSVAIYFESDLPLVIEAAPDIEISGNTTADLGQPIFINVTAIKRNNNDNDNATFFARRIGLSVNGPTNCEAFIEGAGGGNVVVSYGINGTGVIGVGSRASVTYRINSPANPTMCTLRFWAEEDSLINGQSVDIHFQSDLPAVIEAVPDIEISGNTTADIGQPIFINVTAIKRNNNDNDNATFFARRIGISTDGQTICEAFVEGAEESNVVVNYGLNNAGVIGVGSRASVTYRIDSPATATICTLQFWADENGLFNSESATIYFESPVPPVDPEPPVDPVNRPAISISGSLSAFVDEEIALTLNVNKQSSGAATMVSVPTRVASTAGCIASIVSEPKGMVNLPYSPNGAADVVYTIASPSSTATACGSFYFSATEAGNIATLTENRVVFVERFTDSELKVFVNALYSTDIPNLGDNGDINFADLGRFFETPEDARQYRGLDQLLIHTPQVASNDRVFFIEVNVALDTPLTAGQDMSVTFSESFSAGVCSIGPVSISGREQDLSLDDNIARNIYRITAANDAGGTCPELTISVTAAGVTSSITIASGSFIFEPSVMEVINSFGFAPLPPSFRYDQGIVVNWDVRSTDQDEFYPELTLTPLSENICHFGSTQRFSNLRAHASTGSQVFTPNSLLRPGTCRLELTVSENGHDIVREATIELPELAPKPFVRALYTSDDGTATTPAEATEEFAAINTPLWNFNQRRAQRNDFFALINAQGLANLAAGAPYVVPAGGAYLIGINATNSDPGDDAGDIDVTFSERIGDATDARCVANLVRIDGESPSTDYSSVTDGERFVGAIYKITHTDTANGGSCQELIFNVTEDGATGEVILPADTFYFGTGAPNTNSRPTASASSTVVSAGRATLRANINKRSSGTNQQLSVTAVAVGDNSHNCRVTPNNSPRYIPAPGDVVTATAEFAVDFMGELGRGGICSVTVTITENGQRPLIINNAATNIEFTPIIQQVELRIPTSIPSFAVGNTATIDIVAVKKDNIEHTPIDDIINSAEINRVNFNAPELMVSDPSNICRATRFSGQDQNFPSSEIGGEASARYTFFLAPSFTGNAATCIWTISASSSVLPDAPPATQTITVNFAN